MSRKIIEERFWEKVDKSEKCWNWTAGATGKGYGAFRVNGKMRGSHQVSYEFAYGSIPAGLFVCHHCDNPLCVNPSHLFLGTNQDNVNDRDRKGRANQAHGENHVKAKLTEDKVKRIRYEYSRGNTTMTQLAEKYKVGHTTIFDTIHAETWKKVK